MFRKIISFVLVVVSLFCLWGCSNGENSNGIKLTISNFEQYVNVSCRATGASSTYKNGKYSGMIGYATCTGISGYYYDNVSVTINIYFNDGTNDASPTIKLNLNVGGNASGSQYFTICNTKTGYLAYVSSSTISSYSRYSIEYVSGTVKRM